MNLIGINAEFAKFVIAFLILTGGRTITRTLKNNRYVR